MGRKINTFIYTCFIFINTVSFPLFAESVTPDGQVRIADVLNERSGDEYCISFSVDLENAWLKADRMMTLTPVLSSGEERQELSAIVVNGSRRHIMRSRKDTQDENIYKEIKRLNGEKQTVAYEIRIPYREWMNASELSVKYWICGCAGEQESESLLALAQPVKKIEKDMLPPVVAYISPSVEEIKSRSVEGRAYLDFKVGRTEIEPDYRRNPAELEKIRKTIDELKNDANLRVTGVLIHGYASPEGSFASNARLADKRAHALKDYVNNLYHFESSLFTVRSTAEDWAGFRSQVDASSMPEREDILKIIDGSGSEDSKEQALRRLSGGEAFNKLLKDIFPSLRHSDYEVSYVVRGFDVEEAKSLLHKNPGQLSLQELFLVAQTYTLGSPEFNEVFDIAVRLFPDDGTANLNASSIALNRKDWQTARRYLERSDITRAETLNNRGVLAEGENRMEEAGQFYERAAATGLNEGINNLNRIME